jgi:hypothetical protein
MSFLPLLLATQKTSLYATSTCAGTQGSAAANFGNEPFVRLSDATSRRVPIRNGTGASGILNLARVKAMNDSNQSPDEARIWSVLDEFVNALRVKDRDKILSLYLPDVVTFDVVPPLQYVGTEAYGNS